MRHHLFLLFLSCFLALNISTQAAQRCPVCGGKLTKVGSVTDDLKQPSKNNSAINRSFCANPFFHSGSPICTRCWFAYPLEHDRWERSSSVPDSFYRPLSPAIRGVPVPGGQKTGAVYYQYFAKGKFTEEVAIRCSDSPETLNPLRAYARKHNLFFTDIGRGSIRNETFVYLGTEPHEVE